MRTKIEISYDVYDSLQDLPEDERQLISSARQAIDRSYAPYSNFKVGAATLLKSGTIVSGNNIENSVYPITMCAERVALFASESQHYGDTIIKLAIAADTSKYIMEHTISPCGSCRQAIVEFETKQKHPIKILLYNKNGQIITFDSARDLLPLTFDETELKN